MFIYTHRFEIYRLLRSSKTISISIFNRMVNPQRDFNLLLHKRPNKKKLRGDEPCYIITTVDMKLTGKENVDLYAKLHNI